MGRLVETWNGRFYEDFEVGDVFIHQGGRTVTETENVWMALLGLNTNQVHYNAHYASFTTFGRCLVNTATTLSIVGGLSVTDLSANAVANLGFELLNTPNPVFAGDTLYADSTILAKRESKSQPDLGIVTARTRGLNQDGIVVLDLQRSFLVYKRGRAPRDKIQELQQSWAQAGYADILSAAEDES